MIGSAALTAPAERTQATTAAAAREASAEKPKIDQVFPLEDARAVQIGSVNASEFALIANGKQGLAVLQLIGMWMLSRSPGLTTIAFMTLSPFLLCLRSASRAAAHSAFRLT